MTVSVTLKLGLRLLRVRDTRRRISLGLSVVGIALAALSAMVAFASFSVVEHRKEVGLARSAVELDEGQAAHVWARTDTHPYDGQVVFRTDIATDGSSEATGVPKPPGVDRWPGPGELVVSPQFAAEVERGADLASYAPGEIVDHIGDVGLRAPDELVVYRGVSRTELGDVGSPVAAFGGTMPVNQELVDSQLKGLAVFFLTCLGLPVCAFLVVAARLSASTRERRIAALRLMGVTARQATRINAVEQVAVGLAGGVLALAVYPFINRVLADSGVLVMQWFPTTTDVGLVGALVLLTGCAGLSWLVGSRISADAIRSPWQRRREVPQRRARLWYLLPLALGASGLWWLFWQGALVERGANEALLGSSLWMIWAVLLTGLGLLLAAAPLTALVGRWWGRSRRLSRRLGGARAAFDARGSGKLAAGVLVLVFAIGVGIGHSRDARATSELPPGAPAVFGVSLGEADKQQVSALLALEEPYARALEASNYEQGTSVLFTDCEGLRVLASKPVKRCALAEGEGYRLSDDAPARLSLASQGERPVEIPLPERSLDVAGELAEHEAVLPLDSEPARSGAANRLTLVAESSDMDKVMSQVVRIVPYSQPSVFGENPAQAVNNLMLGAYIRLAFVLGGAVALMALLLALLDRAVQRRRVNMRMLAQGMRPAQLRAVQAWEAAASVVPQVAVAWVLGMVGAMAWQYTGGLVREPDWPAFGWLTLGTWLAVAVTVAIAALATPRRVEAQLLRAE